MAAATASAASSSSSSSSLSSAAASSSSKDAGPALPAFVQVQELRAHAQSVSAVRFSSGYDAGRFIASACEIIRLSV